MQTSVYNQNVSFLSFYHCKLLIVLQSKSYPLVTPEAAEAKSSSDNMNGFQDWPEPNQTLTTAVSYQNTVAECQLNCQTL